MLHFLARMSSTLPTHLIHMFNEHDTAGREIDVVRNTDQFTASHIKMHQQSTAEHQSLNGCISHQLKTHQSSQKTNKRLSVSNATNQ